MSNKCKQQITALLIREMTLLFCSLLFQTVASITNVTDDPVALLYGFINDLNHIHY